MHRSRWSLGLALVASPAVFLSFHLPAAAQTLIPAGLQGEWVREESTNTPYDRMRVRIDGDRAVLVHVPSDARKSYRAGQTLWQRLNPDGTVQVLGSDGAYHAGRLRIEGTDVLRL